MEPPLSIRQSILFWVLVGWVKPIRCGTGPKALTTRLDVELQKWIDHPLRSAALVPLIPTANTKTLEP